MSFKYFSSEAGQWKSSLIISPHILEVGMCFDPGPGVSIRIPFVSASVWREGLECWEWKRTLLRAVIGKLDSRVHLTPTSWRIGLWIPPDIWSIFLGPLEFEFQYGTSYAFEFAVKPLAEIRLFSKAPKKSYELEAVEAEDTTDF